jgi:hypothetical protein
VFESEIDSGALLRETHPAAQREAELVRLFAGSERERQGAVSRTKPDGSLERSCGVRGVLRPHPHLVGVFGTTTTLLQQITVSGGPGTHHRLHPKLEP